MMNFIALFMAILSKEKVEDEMTKSIRINALLYYVFFLFLTNAMICFPQHWIIVQVARSVNDMMFRDFGLMLLIYAMLFKAMILLGRMRSSYEE